jgi:hypothetical protein
VRLGMPVPVPRGWRSGEHHTRFSVSKKVPSARVRCAEPFRAPLVPHKHLTHHRAGEEPVGGEAGVRFEPRRKHGRLTDLAVEVRQHPAVGAGRRLAPPHLAQLSEPRDRGVGPEAEQLQRQRRAQRLDRLARVHDDDEAGRRRRDDLLAQVGAAAPLDEPAVRGDLVRPVDRDVETLQPGELPDLDPELAGGPLSPRAASAGSRWATVEPVPRPTAMPSSTSSAAASAAAFFSASKRPDSIARAI